MSKNLRQNILSLSILVVLLLLFLSINSCETYEQGSKIYVAKCANCHGKQAEGLAQMYPPLNSSLVVRDSVDRLVCIIKNGLSGPRRVNGIIYNNHMLPITDLSAVELSNLINYIRMELNEIKDPVKPSDIEQWLEKCD